MRNTILQPPNVHLLSEDVVRYAFLVHGKRSTPNTNGFTYEECVFNDGVDKLTAGPPNQLLAGKVTGGVQRIGLVNRNATSENGASSSKIKGKWKRVKIAGSSGANTNGVTEPSTAVLNRKETCAIIARYVKLGGSITRKQIRAAQRRYVKKPEYLILLLDNAIRDLCVEIETLERQCQRILSSVVSTATDVRSTAVKYFSLIRFGLRQTVCLLGFVREAMAPDVMFNAEYGRDAIVQFWCFANLFGAVNVEVQGWNTSAGGSLVALTPMSVTITKQTLRTMFPHLRTTDNSANNSKQAKLLLNQRLVMHGSTCFDWDNSTRSATRVLAQSDKLTPMLQLMGNLENASIVFEKALISPEFQWRQIMY